MTTYYVRPTIGSNSNGGTSWSSDSWATLKYALDTVTAGDHTIIMDTANADPITSNTTYTLPDGVKIISSADGTSYTAGATVSAGANFGVDITVTGANGAIYGVNFKAANAGTALITLCNTDSNLFCYGCLFETPTINSGAILIGADGGNVNALLKTHNCTFKFAATGHYLSPASVAWRSYGDTFFATGTVPTVALLTGSGTRGADVEFFGANFSTVNTTLISDVGPAQPCQFVFRQSSLGSGTLLSGPDLGGSSIWCYDCSYDNAGTLTGVLFYHEDYFGSTSISTSIYADDGAQYDGTNRCSWVVDGKSTASLATPYCSPWLTVWNDDISTSVTPYLEIARTGSTPGAYTNVQVWSEWMVRNTANSAKAQWESDAGNALSSANQTTSGLAYSDWTGLDADDWCGKLEAPAALTPDEIGHVSVKICVAGDYTVYVDPQVRGLA